MQANKQIRSDTLINRIGEEKLNNQGCLMKIIKYNKNTDIIVEFQDEYNVTVHTSYQMFLKGKVKNPYYPSVFGIGIIGNKYNVKTNGVTSKEYQTWKNMLQRCFYKKTKEEYQTYENVSCCDEWLLYDNFYEWLHSQENFEKWLNGDYNKWDLDKDILIKGNKIYSPNTCCLVPKNVNNLFIKQNKNKIGFPIGVAMNDGKFEAQLQNPITKQHEYIGRYDTPENAFYLGYKPNKENYIKQIAHIEYDKGNITRKCYEAMMKYNIEITD